MPFDLNLEAGRAALRREDPKVRQRGGQILIALARKDNPDAMIALGDDKLELSPVLARNQYRKAAKLGSTTAMVRLGASYETEGKNREALAWFRQAAEGDDPAGLEWLERLGEPLAPEKGAPLKRVRNHRPNRGPQR
jgi:TPR repeat protein